MQVQKRNAVIGAGVGAAAGAVAGIKTGAKKAAPILAKAQEALKLSELTKDAYVNGRQNEALERLIGSDVKGTKVAEAVAKVGKKAAEDFESIITKAKEAVPSLMKKAKNTKVKWIALGVAAGVAAGALIGKLLTKKADKTEKA